MNTNSPEQAYQIDPRNVQALLLKGSVLQHMSKTQEALLHFREAVRMAPFRFEAHQGIITNKNQIVILKRTLGFNSMCQSVSKSFL